MRSLSFLAHCVVLAQFTGILSFHHPVVNSRNKHSSVTLEMADKKSTLTQLFQKALISCAILPAILNGSPCLALESASVDATSTVKNDANIPVYFGVGCFWHVQHEFVQAEKNILGRSDYQITATAGYAGGTKVGKGGSIPGKGAVCYYNLQGVADYGSLGHGEVVGMKIPSEAYGQFADEYFSLFGSDLERPDKGDRGPEYRSLVGLPGGISSPLYPMLQQSADKRGIKLVAGKGNDPDTLGTKSVWVMDSTSTGSGSTNGFTFHPAELYHQFHDGFMPGEGYPQSYNNMAKLAYEAGRIGFTGCPDSEPR
eukprot:gene7417-15155_t